MLSILLIIPIIGSLSLLIISNEQKIKIISLVTSLLALGQSLLIWIQFNDNFHEFQFVQEWSEIGFCHFHIGIDGISLFFIILTTFIFTISVLASWTSITENIKSFYISLLILESLLIAVFIVLDLFLFYITFESVLIPMSLLIGMFGSDKKIKAVFYFFLYTLLGSLFMLFSILFIYSITGTTDLQLLYFTQISSNAQYLIWLGFFVAFVVKTPLIPLHIWLPYAHVNSPLAGSIILAGILLKLAVYGIIRILLPILPDATIYFTPMVYTIALISIIYASCATLRQIDLKSIIAYSSIPHMGVVILGLFSNTVQGIEGAIFLSIAHGIVSPALFILVTLLYERHGSKVLKYYRGLVTNMPIFAVFFFIFTIANCATPLTANFIGELLSFMGSFKMNPIITALAGISMILSAGYSFWLFGRVCYGQESSYLFNVRDVTRREFFVLLPLVFLTILFGIFPNIILDSIHFSVSTLIIDTSADSLLSSLNSSSQILNSPPLLAFFPTFVIKKFSDNSTSEGKPSSTPIYEDILSSRSKIMKDLKDKSGVYQFINKEDPSKCYIGSSLNLLNRIQTHIALGNNSNYSHISLLYRAVQKYSWNSFKLIILEFTSNIKEDILAREQYYLDFYRPYYNILTEAGSSQGAILSESTKAKLSEAKGSTVYIYSSDSFILIGTFPSIRKAADILNISDKTIIKYIHNNYVYKNKWIFSFSLLEPGFQPLEYIKKGSTIYVYKDSKFFKLFHSAIYAAKFFRVYYTTILKYAQDNILFQDTYIFSLTPLPQESLPALFKQIKNTQSITIYLYSYDPKSTNFQLLSSFASSSIAAQYLNTSINRVLRYARSHHVLDNKYILLFEPLTSDFRPSLGVIKPGSKGTTIYLYSLDHQKLEIFSSLREAGEYFQSNHSTILKYAKSNNIFKNQYILSLEELSPKIISD